MKTIVALGLLAVAVVAFVAGLLLVGYAALGTGGLWLAVTDSEAPPNRQSPVEREPRRRDRRGWAGCRCAGPCR